MANYNLTQTGDEVQAYIDSIPVIDVTGTLSGSNIVLATNPYSQIAANYSADCGSIIRLTVAGDVYVIRITGYDSTYYTGSVFKDNQYISVEIGELSAQGMIEDANAVALIPVTGTESGGSITLSSNPFTRVQTAVNAGQHVVVRVTVGSDIVDFTMNTYSDSVATYIGTANFLQNEFQLLCSASSAAITNRSTSNTFSTGESVPSVGIDDVPTQGSDNLVKSGGVWGEVNEVVSVVPEIKLGWTLNWQGKLTTTGTTYRFVTFIAPKEMDVSVTYLNSNSYVNNGKLFVLPSIDNLVADYVATILHSFVKDVEGTYSVHLQEGNVLCVSNMSGDTYSFSSSVTIKEKISELQSELGGKVNLISPTSIMPQEGASVYVYKSLYKGTIIGQTYRNRTVSVQSFNIIRVGLRCSIADAVLRVFKVPSIYWTGSNYSLPTMANLELLYEGAYYNSGSGSVNDYQVILPNIVELAQNESIFAVVFGSARVIDMPTSHVNSEDGTSGYFCVFSNPTYPYNYETITLSVGRGTYCCVPPTMELLPIYATLSEYTKDVRPRIDIYTSDTEIEILEKMIKAGTIGNADVYWEAGTYTFSEVYIYMRDTLKWSWRMGLPIGNGCRYYLNGSTIISNAPAETYSDSRFAFDTRMKGDLEMYDGTIIGNNATYCIHDEMGNPFFPDAYIHKYKNIVFEYTGTTHPFGAGVNFNSRYIFENCVFKSDISGGFHGPTNSDNLPVHFELTIIGCYFQRSPLSATSQFDSTRDDIRLIYANNSAKTAISTAANSIVKYLNEIRP